METLGPAECPGITAVGAKSVPWLNGMFASAIWDTQPDELGTYAEHVFADAGGDSGEPLC